MTITDLEMERVSAKQASAIAVALFTIPIAATHGFDRSTIPSLSTPAFQISQESSTYPAFHNVEVMDYGVISDAELAAQMLRIHDKLIEEQVSLDSQAETLLAKNLWDLYL